MARRWVLIIAIGLVLLGGAWDSAVGVAYDVTKLKSLCVPSGKLSVAAMQDHDLSREAIKNHVYVWLRGKLPKLRVERFTGAYRGACSADKPTLYARVSIGTSKGKGTKVGYYGQVSIVMDRRTTWESGKVGWGIAYSAGTLLTGPMGSARTHVNDVLEELLTEFAAEYYKAGNR